MNITQLFAFGTTLLLASCASSKIKEAAILGKAGGEITGNAQKPIAGMSAQVGGSATIAEIASLFPGMNPPAAGDLASRKNVQTHLKGREKAFKQLEETYGSFAALAEFKAGETIGTDVKNLGDSINKFAKAVGAKASPISESVSALLEAGAKAITEEAQHKMLHAASTDIRSCLASLRGVLEADADDHKEMLDEVTGQKVDNFKFIVAQSPGAAQPFLEKQLGKIGLQADDATVAAALPPPEPKQPDPAAAADPPNFESKVDIKKVQKLSEVFKAELDSTTALHMKFYEATIDALKKLEAGHLSFESSARLNPHALLDQAKTLAKLAEAYQKVTQ